MLTCFSLMKILGHLISKAYLKLVELSEYCPGARGPQKSCVPTVPRAAVPPGECRAEIPISLLHGRGILCANNLLY